MKLKTITTFFYLVISIPIFLFFRENVSVWFSFFINYMLITYIAYYHLNKERVYSPFLSSYLVFNFLFFIVAPILQISSIKSNNFIFINGFPYNVWDIVFANLLIFVFNIVFFLSYLAFKKRYLKPKKQKSQKLFLTPLLILILFLLSLVILVFNSGFILDEINLSVYAKTGESVFSILVRKKVLFLVPLGAIVISYKYLKLKKRLSTNTIIAFIILIVLLIVLLIFKNPLIEKRNALGPIYITLIYLFYPKIINSNVKTFLFLFLSMVFMFPLLSALTHIDLSLKEIIANPQLIAYQFIANGGILDAFNSLNYDAFANIMATVEYVGQYGNAYGYQILSAVLFFIPRSIWVTKPFSTGEVVGNYLIQEHGFTFSNLSNPVVSEGYINFGIIGVFLMAIALSFFIVIFIKWLHSTDVLKEIIAFYFAIHLIFLLRGDFTNGFVYFIGTFIGVIIIPKLILKSLKILFKKD